MDEAKRKAEHTATVIYLLPCLLHVQHQQFVLFQSILSFVGIREIHIEWKRFYSDKKEKQIKGTRDS